MLKHAKPGGFKILPTIELDELIEDEPLSFDAADLQGCTLEVDIDSEVVVETNHNPNAIGECDVCHKIRRLWSGVCGWCGADPEDFDEE